MRVQLKQLVGLNPRDPGKKSKGGGKGQQPKNEHQIYLSSDAIINLAKLKVPGTSCGASTYLGRPSGCFETGGGCPLGFFKQRGQGGELAGSPRPRRKEKEVGG